MCNCPVYSTWPECRTDGEKKEVRRKAESYLNRAEQLKQLLKESEGEFVQEQYSSCCICQLLYMVFLGVG